MQQDREILEGWALRNRVISDVLRPESRIVLEGLRDHLGGNPVIGRGGGASYGDAALNDSGLIVDLRTLNRILDFDTTMGTITCESGMTLVDLQAAVVPHGWFVPVTPGAGQASLGGCVSCDVHGKNHEKQGTFGQNVTSLTLLTASGNAEICSPENNSELFWATVGGMGLTGVILDMTLQLIPIETAYMSIDIKKTASLDETFAAQQNSNDKHYSVTWIDPLSTGKSLGRGVVMNANSTKRSALPEKYAQCGLSWPHKKSYEFPWTPARGLFRPLFLRAFNNLFYARQKNVERIQHAHPYLFPLHTFKDINRLYGANGFYEYQIAVPEASAYELVRYFLTELQKYKAGSFLTILKKFGPQNSAPMSFPIDGITFSIQVLANDPAISKLLDQFDEKTAEAGGRVYLAKDSRLRPHFLDTMYPQRLSWIDSLDKIDPDHVFDSNMNRRLGLRDKV